MTPQTNNPGNVQQEDGLSIQDILSLCLGHWLWFVISVILSVGMATVYLMRTPKSYTRTASIMIKDDQKGNSIGGMDQAFSQLGLFQSNTNVQNELISIQSPDLMLEIVRRMSMDVSYSVDGTFHEEQLYGTTAPIKVSFPEIADNMSVSFDIDVQENGTVSLSRFADIENEYDDVVNSKIDSNLIETPIGKIKIEKNEHFQSALPEGKIHVRRNDIYTTTDNITKNFKCSLSQKEATIIEISYTDVLPRRAEDAIRTLISVYNENWVKDKNQIAVSTSAFINERLKVIEKDLGNVDSDISSYKSEHLIPDIAAASNMAMQQASEANASVMDLNNQVYMARYIKNYLSNNSNRNQLLPANSGITNAAIENQIGEYNTTLLKRNNLVANSSETNPLVVDMDASLSYMRSAIITSIDNELKALDTRIRSLQQYSGQATSQISSNPKQARYLLSVERQQKVKESLYLFLLQKREENELNQAFTAYNTRIVSEPHGSQFPTAPVTRNILLIGLVLGLCIPAGILYARESLNTKIRGKKDLEGKVTLPYLGEIPFIKKKDSEGKKRILLGKRGKKQEEGIIAVEEGKRDVINEAFRVVRTNLEFMIGNKDGRNVSIITSYNPGSGKSFLAINMGISLAIKKGKVLIIDTDLRRGSTSAYINSPEEGLSDYLAARTNDIEHIIVKGTLHPNLDIIPIGTMPPNPTELLLGERMQDLISSVRGKYDYVFLDCPPVEIVADTTIVEKLADRTIFIIRVGLLERSMLTQLEQDYQTGKYKNMAVLINGAERGGRYGSRYGYRYGYSKDGEYHYGSKKK